MTFFNAKLSDSDRLDIELIASGASIEELTDHQFDVLFNYYCDLGELPYCVAKARDGDPYVWVHNKIEAEYNEGKLDKILGGL